TGEGGLGQPAEEDQTGVPAAQTQLHPVLARVQGHPPGQVDATVGPGRPQAEIHIEHLARKVDAAALEQEVGLAQAGVLEGQAEGQLGLGRQAVAAPQGQAAAQLRRHGREQGEQGQGHTTERERAIPQAQGARQGQLHGLGGESGVAVLPRQPEMAAHLGIDPRVEQTGALESGLQVEAGSH
ncbi:MAG: hypothetical protein ACK559_07615, partial [bacterium]